MGNGTGEFNSLLTRKGYKNNGGSAMNLMFVSLWNNGCTDLGGSGNKNICVFQRFTTSDNALMPSKKSFFYKFFSFILSISLLKSYLISIFAGNK